jgi:molybdopterin synthase sulfur carrier subunit
MPSLRLPDALRRYTGGEALVEVGGETVAEALAAAFDTYPDLRIRLVDEVGHVHRHLVAFHNEIELPREGLEDAGLEPGDTLTFLEAIGGG